MLIEHEKAMGKGVAGGDFGTARGCSRGMLVSSTDEKGNLRGKL
jgi:hypothetical protein